MKESPKSKRSPLQTSRKCRSKVYLRSDTVFLHHFKEKRLSQQLELNEEEKQQLEKQRFISKQTDLLHQQLVRQSLVPFRSVLSQVGRTNVGLHALPEYLESLCSIISIDPYVRQLDLSFTVLSRNICHHLSQLLWTNKYITVLRLHKCGLNGFVLTELVNNGKFDNIENVALSGNNISGYDSQALCILLSKCLHLTEFSLKANHLETIGCRVFGEAIGKHTTLEDIDLSWNHIRRNGAIDIARGIQESKSLTSVNLSWNGFSYEGCSALSEALRHNTVLTELNLACNRIHPPALLELVKGLSQNSTLLKLDLSHNPITPAFTTIFLEGINESSDSGLRELKMERVVVDQDFPKVVRCIQEHREFHVTYERSLPLRVRPEKIQMEVQAPSVFNLDPLKLLYLLKEKNRVQDFFNKINKDNDDVLTIEELQALFREMGLSVTRSVVEKIMEFMDTDESGSIDLGEFLEGDRRIRKMSRDFARSAKGQQSYNKHSRSFTGGHIDPMTFRLKINEPKQLLPPIKSRESSISPVLRKW